MNNKNGFTLVEILAAVAILAVLATAAGLGITSSINKQKQKLAYQAEENIAEAAKSYASNKINNYLKPCVNSDGSFVTITEKKVNAIFFIGYNQKYKNKQLKNDTKRLLLTIQLTYFLLHLYVVEKSREQIRKN